MTPLQDSEAGKRRLLIPGQSVGIPGPLRPEDPNRSQDTCSAPWTTGELMLSTQWETQNSGQQTIRPRKSGRVPFQSGSAIVARLWPYVLPDCPSYTLGKVAVAFLVKSVRSWDRKGTFVVYTYFSAVLAHP